METETEVVDNGEQPSENPVEEAPAETTGGEMVPYEEQPPAQTRTNLFAVPAGSIQGQLDTSDYEIPQLKLCQYVGPLIEEYGFTPGDWVANNETILWQEGCAPVEVTILNVVKQFVEKTEYGSDVMGRIFNSTDEAEAAGLVTTWGPNGEKPDTEPTAACLCLVKLPEGVDGPAFDLEYGDDRYALLMWRIGGVAYGRTFKKITGAARTRLRNGLHTGSFFVSAKKEKGSVNTYWLPVLEPGNQHDEDFINFALEQLGQSQG